MRATCEEIGWRNYRYAARGDCGMVYNIAKKAGYQPRLHLPSLHKETEETAW